MLPLTVLAGAFVQLDVLPLLPVLIGVTVVSRLALELLRGLVLSRFVAVARRSPVVLGLGMASPGAFSIGCAVAIATRFPASIGGSALVLAAAGVLVGELVGPLSLRHALESAGEIVEGESITPPPPSFDYSKSERRSTP
jgi:hypothetical protein